MNVIVAVDENWGIGKDGDQLVYLSQDLKRFKALTTGHPVLLGRKTLATFPGGRPLKNRRNLILSTDPAFCPGGRGGLCHLEGRPGRRAGGYLCHWRSLRMTGRPWPTVTQPM